MGSDDWTTLPDANGKTSTVTGDSCGEGWSQLHPFLAHYQAADCSPTGSTGSWNAATGTSSGWKEFVVDLSGYAGKQVDVSINVRLGLGTQGVGVFLDDARVLVDGSTVAETSFESADLGGWTVAGPPAGSAGNAQRLVAQPAGVRGGLGGGHRGRGVPGLRAGGSASGGPR